MHVSGGPDSMLQLLEIRPLSVDDLSTARYVISAAFSRSAKEHYSAADIEAFSTFVRSPHYADILLGNHSYAAWVGSEIVGIAAWGTSEAKNPTARVQTLYVHPLFSGHGIGTRLAEFLRDEAAAAGYRALEASATINTVPFFERLGFIEIRRAVWALPSERKLPIALMREVTGARSGVIH